MEFLILLTQYGLPAIQATFAGIDQATAPQQVVPVPAKPAPIDERATGPAEPPTCPSRSEAGVYISSFGVEGDEIGVEGDDIYLPPPPSDSLKCFFF